VPTTVAVEGGTGTPSGGDSLPLQWKIFVTARRALEGGAPGCSIVMISPPSTARTWHSWLPSLSVQVFKILHLTFGLPDSATMMNRSAGWLCAGASAAQASTPTRAPIQDDRTMELASLFQCLVPAGIPPPASSFLLIGQPRKTA